MKNFAIVFSPEVLIDIEEAFAYYEKIQTELGRGFGSQLMNTLNAIKRNPFFASIRYNDIRCAAIKRSPFLIHYILMKMLAL